MSKNTTLYSRDGRKYATGDPVEITRLKAHGYTDTAPKAKAPKPTPAPSDK